MDTAQDDVGPLVLSLIALAAFPVTLGILLVPVWPPEVVPVLASGTIVLTLFSQGAALRNAFRRREYLWLPLIALFGPVGVLAYSLTKTTESGILAGYLEQLSRQISGEQGAEGE